MALVACLLFLPGIAGRDLWAPDEPRMALVAREMLRSGDWLVPRDSGRPYRDKPPLLFWLIALASLPAGEVNAPAARLVVAACGVGTVLATAAIGRIWFGAAGGWAAGLILATSWRMFVSAQWVQTDGALALFTTLSVLGMARALHRGDAGGIESMLIHGGIAAALLCKGPVGIVAPALAVTGWCIAERAWLPLKVARPWLAPLAALPVLGWALSAQHASGGALALGETLRQHALERFSRGLHHLNGPFYYSIVFPLEFMPWTLFLLSWIGVARPVAGVGGAGRRRALLWLLAHVLFFSLSAEKRSVYLLPAFPAAALLLAGLLPSAWPRPGAPGRKAALAPFGLLAAVAAGAGVLGIAAVPRLGSGAWILCAGSFLGAAAALAGLRAAARGKGMAGLAAAAGASAGVLLGVSLGAAPALDAVKSARPFCERVMARVGLEERLAILAPYRSAFAFYTGRALAEIGDEEELSRYLIEKGSYCILGRDQYDRLPDRLRAQHPVLVEGRVGHRIMALVGRPLSPAASTRGNRPRRRAPAPSCIRGCATSATRTTGAPRRPSIG
jgi:4-amino-4-deoxy-L-arabinose transferase-like glycosyltransferase